MGYETGIKYYLFSWLDSHIADWSLAKLVYLDLEAANATVELLRAVFTTDSYHILVLPDDDDDLDSDWDFVESLLLQDAGLSKVQCV
jgi:hypothetical protein